MFVPFFFSWQKYVTWLWGEKYPIFYLNGEELISFLIGNKCFTSVKKKTTFKTTGLTCGNLQCLLFLV